MIESSMHNSSRDGSATFWNQTEAQRVAAIVALVRGL